MIERVPPKPSNPALISNMDAEQKVSSPIRIGFCKDDCLPSTESYLSSIFWPMKLRIPAKITKYDIVSVESPFRYITDANEAITRIA